MMWTARLPVLLLCSVAAVLVFPGTVVSVNSSTALSELPECAVNCIFKAAANSTCDVYDQACICADSALENTATWCIRASCTAKETLCMHCPPPPPDSKNFTSTACQVPIRDRGTNFSTMSSTLGVITGVFIILRVTYRVWLSKDGGMAADDWLALILTFCGVPATAIDKHGLVANGLGRDVWTLPYIMVYRFGKYLYAMEILYFIDSVLLKATLLVFYLRIFPSIRVRRLLWGTVIVTAAIGIMFVFLAVFQCRPISYFWTRWDGEHTGSCLSINAVAWAHAAIGIAVDLWMLAIPMSQLRGLRLHWKKKVGVALMFCVGTFVTIVSILRLQTLLNFANSINPTWEDYDVASWSTIEINVGIICSCMPSFRLLLVHYFPTVLGNDSKREYYHAHHYRSPSHGGLSIHHSHNNLDSPPNKKNGPYDVPLVISPSALRILKMDATVSDPPPSRRTSNGEIELKKPSRIDPNSDTAFPSVPPNTQETIRPSLVRVSSTKNLARSVSCGGIMYTKSYAIEYYGREYHDQARLMRSDQPGNAENRQSMHKTFFMDTHESDRSS